MDKELLISTNEPLPKKWGQRIIDIMKLEYGQKFVGQWGGLDESQISDYWASELSRFSVDEIRRGISAMKASQWPPTLPEFRIMCRPCLDYQKAHHEAVKGVSARHRGEDFEWSHPAVYWAAVTMAYDLKLLPYAQIKSRWDNEISEQFAMQSWPEVPKVARQIAYTPATRSESDVAESKQRFKEELAKMRKFSLPSED